LLCRLSTAAGGMGSRATEKWQWQVMDDEADFVSNPQAEEAHSNGSDNSNFLLLISVAEELHRDRFGGADSPPPSDGAPASCGGGGDSGGGGSGRGGGSATAASILQAAAGDGRAAAAAAGRSEGLTADRMEGPSTPAQVSEWRRGYW